MAGKKITQVLNELRGGVFVNAASDELSALVQRIHETGKKGKITIELTLEPHGKSNREIHVIPKLLVKMPPQSDTVESGIFFAVRGDLVRDDPDQKVLPGMNGPESVRTGTDN